MFPSKNALRTKRPAFHSPGEFTGRESETHLHKRKVEILRFRAKRELSLKLPSKRKNRPEVRSAEKFENGEAFWGFLELFSPPQNDEFFKSLKMGYFHYLEKFSALFIKNCTTLKWEGCALFPANHDIKNGDSHICISDLRDDQRLSGNSSLSNSPQTAIRSDLGEYLPACECDQEITRLPLLLHVYVHWGFARSFLYQLSVFRRSPACEISVQILCDICNSNVCDRLLLSSVIITSYFYVEFPWWTWL